MMKQRFIGIIFFIIVIIFSFYSFAQKDEKGREYPNGHGGTVYFPLGDISFADEVVSYVVGNPAPVYEKDRDSQKILSIPDYNEKEDVNFLTLGCGGTITLRFVDNALVDIDGYDLYVFEIGPAVEATELEISEDGKNWIKVGKIKGGMASVDIKPFVKRGQIFQYVRLTDLKEDCGSKWPGADIDAVGAIGSILQFSLSSSVLFDFNKFDLKEEALAELLKISDEIKKYPDSKIIISGHTDSIGTEEFNKKLSEKRAAAVRDFLKSNGLENYEFEIYGYGKARPVSSNETEEGRAKNRRVEIMVLNQ